MKTDSDRSAFCLTAILTSMLTVAILLSACGESAVKNANARNTAVNASSNTYAANTPSNTLNTTSTNSAPRVLITADTLKTALKERLMHDGLHILKDRDWERDEWLSLSVGDFYHSNDATAKQKISDTTAEVLRTANRIMTPSAQQRLEDSVSSLTNCKTALELMHTATRDTNTTDLVF